MNVGIYKRGLGYWAMTERPESEVDIEEDTLKIGPSALHWDGQRLTIDIDEVTAPLPRRIRGQITVEPQAPLGQPITLDASGDHRWWPIAPVSRVSVNLSRPNLQWDGFGYLDSNRGGEPLEDGVKTWTWSRVSVTNPEKPNEAPDVAVLYDLVRRRDESRMVFGRTFDVRGNVKEFEPAAVQQLPTSLWRMKRSVASDSGSQAPKVLRTAEDSPFYTRSIITTGLGGQQHLAMHESLNMDYFRQWWMKALMPVRMPRQIW